MFSWNNNNTRRANYPGSRSSVPAPAIQGSIRPPTYSRQQHLDSYLKDDKLSRSTRRVSADDSTYDTVFQTVANDTLILRVHLPHASHPSAPVPRPTMTLAGVRARHSWIDSRMRVIGYAKIANDEVWRVENYLLGDVVKEVIEHFQLYPPEIIEITDVGLQRIQPKQGGSQQFPSRPPQNSNHRSSASTDAPPEYESLLNVPELEMPKVPTHFPELDSLSRDELDDLFEDELSFMSFCNKLEISNTIHNMSNQVLDENVAKAKSNLEKEGELKELHKEVTELQRKLKESLNEFEILEKEQNAICKPPDQRNVLKELARLKKEAFDESEQFAEKWLEDGSDAANFVQEFLDKRKIHHIRAAKFELLQRNKMGY